jgi:two-component system, cell cycle response regulator
MERVIKRPQDLVARYGGEEFVIILPNTGLEVALMLAEALRQEIHRIALPHEQSSVASHVTLSLGISCLVPNDNLQASQIVAHADEALYQAKRQGRDRCATFQ